MFAKNLTAGLVASTLLATVAFAQAPATPADRASATPAASSAAVHGDWRTSKVVGLNVYNDNNESLGSINDLLTDKTGNIKAVVIGVGGVLGVGEHLVAIPFEKIKFVNDPVAYAAGTATGTGTSATRPAPTMTPPAGSSVTTGAATGDTGASSTKANPWHPDHAVLSATKDELKAMPEFKYSM